MHDKTWLPSCYLISLIRKQIVAQDTFKYTLKFIHLKDASNFIDLAMDSFVSKIKNIWNCELFLDKKPSFYIHMNYDYEMQNKYST